MPWLKNLVDSIKRKNKIGVFFADYEMKEKLSSLRPDNYYSKWGGIHYHDGVIREAALNHGKLSFLFSFSLSSLFFIDPHLLGVTLGLLRSKEAPSKQWSSNVANKKTIRYAVI